MQFAKNKQFCSVQANMFRSVLCKSCYCCNTKGIDSMWMVNYKKCPHFLFPISILVGGNYDLLRNTQNTNGVMWKDISVTDLQPQSVTSKYWCRKCSQFRKAVETLCKAPAGEGAGVSEEPCCTLDVDVKLCRAGGRLWGRHMEEVFGANRTMRWHRQRAESEEILLSRETESIRTGSWKSRRKAKNFSKMQKQGYARRKCRTSSISPVALSTFLCLNLWFKAWITRDSHVLCSKLVSANENHWRKMREGA
jgi:hypothetical protein